MTGVWVLPAALVDARTAFGWYEAERQGLGGEFAQAVQAALDRILEFPATCPVAQPRREIPSLLRGGSGADLL